MVASASVHINENTQTTTCSYVDGIAGAAGCTQDPAPDADHVVDVRQQSKVAQGSHTVQTIVNSVNEQGKIVGWAVEYSIYERRIPAN